MSWFNYHDENGFTLVELMIVLLLSILVLASLGSAYFVQRKSASAQDDVAELQQNIRAAMFLIERDVRMAGYDPLKNAGAGFVAATANDLTFTMLADSDGVNNDSDGNTDEPGELATIRYRLYDSLSDGDLELGRQLGAVPQAAVENIDAIEFFYTMEDGTQVLNPTDLDEIRAITVSVLARTQVEDINYQNSQTYTPASGATGWDLNGGDAGTGNPVNDSFRRRLLTTTIQCRNMGI